MEFEDENKECPYCREENPEYLEGGKDFGDDSSAVISLGYGNYIEVEIWTGAFTPNPESHGLSIPITNCPRCKRDL